MMTQPAKAISTFVLGTISTAIAIGIVWAIGRYADVEVLGIYFLYIVPVGALGAGYLSGYGFRHAIKTLEPKLTLVHQLIVALILFVGFLSIDYIHFRESNFELSRLLIAQGLSAETAMGTLPSFLDWLQLRYEGMTYDGVELGVVGYGLGLLEIAGFMGAGTFGLLYGTTHDFCDSCQKRMSKENLFVVPGGSSEAEEEEASAQIHAFLAALKEEQTESLRTSSECLTALAGEREFTGDVTYTVDQVRCPVCWSGPVVAKRNVKKTRVESEVMGKASVSGSLANVLRDSLA